MSEEPRGHYKIPRLHNAPLRPLSGALNDAANAARHQPYPQSARPLAPQKSVEQQERQTWLPPSDGFTTPDLTDRDWSQPDYVPGEY